MRVRELRLAPARPPGDIAARAAGRPALPFYKHHPPPGSSPGSLTPPVDAAPTTIRVMVYGPDGVEERPIHDPAELVPLRRAEHVAWIDVQGLADVELLQRIGAVFDLHPIALEDAVNVPVRPRTEPYDGYHQIVSRMVQLDAAGALEVEQITLYVGDRWLLSIQEWPGDCFDPVRERIRRGGRHTRMGADYLAYTLLDSVLDGYYPLLEQLGEELEALEEAVIGETGQRLLSRIYQLRRNLVTLRRSVWPQRDMLSELLRGEGDFFGEEVLRFLTNCHTHAVQISDVVDAHRDLAASLAELHLSMISTRTNEVVKVLTVVTSIFIPLTFIVGVYGMNFDYMPELRSRWGYPGVWLFMIGLALGLLVYFRRRGWLARGDGAQ
jgi:magnesium transporter